MHRRGAWAAAAVVAIVAGTALGSVDVDRRFAPGAASADGGGPTGLCDERAGRGSRTAKIADAKLIVEFNATDGDAGVHGAFDDDGWKALCVLDPDGTPVLRVGPRAQLRDLSMAGIFFESREPPLDEFSLADLRAAFPEGSYAVRARAFDGRILVGSATFTHDVPRRPRIVAPALAEEPRDARKDRISARGLIVRWRAVTRTVDGRPLDLTGYEVIVTKEDHDDPHGFSRPIYDIHVPPGLTSLRVPRAFLEPRTVYELEVLALEASGNQTISVGFFATT